MYQYLELNWQLALAYISAYSNLQYESGDEVDPNAEFEEENEDELYYADAERLPSIVCTPKVLSVAPSSSEQR